MNEALMLQGAEPRKILQILIGQEAPAIMTYLSKGKWYVAKVLLTELGANVLTTELAPRKKPHPINIQADQPVGVSIKYGYGKFIFETKVISLQAQPQATTGGTILLAAPEKIEVMQRRSFYRVEVPKSIKVNVVLWHRRQRANAQVPAENYWPGQLIDISAGGLQVAIDTDQNPDFRQGQFIGLRFTPMPYEKPVMFNAQIRNILPTANEKDLCLGLQIVGLEASPEGHQTLQRLCGIVERYYQMNQTKNADADIACQATVTAPQ